MSSGLPGYENAGGAAAHGETALPLAGALPPQCRRDVDTLRRFVRETAGIGRTAAAMSPDAFREVLLTGATGFVGRFLLRDLLRRNAGLVVHCLVRAEDETHGLARIRNALEEAEIWEEPFAARLRAVAGDVCEVRFGASGPDFDTLCRRIDAVYHLAADLTLTSPYLTIRKLNTFSVRNVLELCLRIRRKHLFFFSSLGVFPQYVFGFANEFAGRRIDHHMQPDVTEMKRKYPLGLLGYPWSKLVAEQVLSFAHAAGLPVAIFRLPNTSAASNGFLDPHDIGARVLAAAVDVEMMPRGLSIRRPGEPVDVLSRTCAAISTNPHRRHTFYHCCDPRPALHEVEPADFGSYWPEVPYASFKRACQARGERSPLHGHWALLDHVAPYWFGDRDPGAALPICDRAMREDCPDPIGWPGLLTLVRRSGDWLDRHRGDWPHPVAEPRLDFNRLMAHAERCAERAGVPSQEAYPEWMRDGLARLVKALNAPKARLREERRGFLVFDLSRLLRNNAALARERERHPEIEGQEIDRPVFIVGINRTGTTFLHRLMARDERFWTLRGYEYFLPVRPESGPAPPSDSTADPRRAALADLSEAAGSAEHFAGIHHFGIEEPEEDFPLLRLGFAAWTTLVTYRLPGYARWLAHTGSKPAYAHHRRIVERFTWERRLGPATRDGQWLFKMPFHLKELQALVETYPDALFVQTHRKPSEVMGSWNSLAERARSLAIEPRPAEETGREQLAFMSDMLNGATRFRLARPDLEHRWVDVAYADLIRDPMAVVRDIYRRFGWSLEPDAVHAMEAWRSVQEERRRRETRHTYRLGDYGLTSEAVNRAFEPYLDFAAARGLLPGEPPGCSANGSTRSPRARPGGAARRSFRV